MKKSIFCGLLGMLFFATGCNQNTYSNLRKKEDKLIANYISRNGLVILDKEPVDGYVWAENEYYIDSVSHTQNDTVNQKIIANDLIVARYKQFGLTEDADTLSYWTTLDVAYPLEFHYLNLSECESTAWHAAIQLMKYPDSQCQIIVPSKLGFSNEQTTVTPYVYILKIKVKQ